jgi:hypothetical protein
VKKLKQNEGAVTLEACIVVTLFIFLMLFLYSLFIMFLGHNSIGRAVLESAESLSLDPYYSETLLFEDTYIEGAPDSLGDLIAIAGGLLSLSMADEHFSSSTRWYHEGDVALRSLQVEEVARNRFIAYFANGDADEAIVLLEKYNVVNGLDGLDFSKSKVENNVLYIRVSYRITYEFNLFNLFRSSDGGSQEVVQSAKSRLWK